MDDKKTSAEEEKEKISKSILDKFQNRSKSDEMEEFQLKIHVDLEEALSRRDDYLDILEEVYSQSEGVRKEELKKFGLVPAEKTESIYLISCVYKSGRPLFNYSLSNRFNYSESLNLILTAIKNYVQYKLGELLEVLSLKSYTIHLFVVEEDYIVSIITSKQVTRDKVSSLATQIGIILNKYPRETPDINLDLKKAIDQIVDGAIASLVREHHTLKIILIGDGAVGKTSIRRQYLGEGFKSDYQMTIGADLASKYSSLIYSGGKQIKFLIWDLAGQPRFENVRKAYYMSAVGALVVFDATRPESFTNTIKWMNELWRNNGRGPVPLLVLANKVDLCGEEGVTCVAEEKSLAFVNRLSQISEQYRGFKIHFLPTSAKTGQNIDIAFEILGEAIIDFLNKIKS
ncbi:MAG: Rab family GTPase [Candidatus Hodarchaeales archaeon]|jgi:small GTP-binding protein